jgi:hypothetical protein
MRDAWDVCEALRSLKIQPNSIHGDSAVIYDRNGNTVGKWEVTESAKTQKTADAYASLADLYASLAWHVSQNGAVGMDQKRLDDAYALLKHK